MLSRFSLRYGLSVFTYWSIWSGCLYNVVILSSGFLVILTRLSLLLCSVCLQHNGHIVEVIFIICSVHLQHNDCIFQVMFIICLMCLLHNGRIVQVVFIICSICLHHDCHCPGCLYNMSSAYRFFWPGCLYNKIVYVMSH